MPGPGTWSPGDVLTAADLNAIGTWTSYTPTLTQSVARTATVNYAEYVQINKMVIANVDLTCTTTGTLANIRVSPPINFPSTYVTDLTLVGSGIFFDSSATTTSVLGVVASATSYVEFRADNSTALLNTTLGNGDVISFSIVYEVA
jgi:hypothetical protein